MNCSRCNKRLSRKRARVIGGKVLCSPCMFGNDGKVDRGRPVPDHASPMKLTAPFTIQFSGDPARFRSESLRRSDKGFAYLLDRMFSGEEVSEKELLSWGLTVTVIEPDEFITIPKHPEGPVS